MKKLLLSLLAVFALTANAQKEVFFDFDNNYQTYFPGMGVSSGTGASYVADGEFSENKTVTVDGVTVTITASAADAATRNRIWTSAPRLRMYNESFTIAAPGHKITAIVFKGHSSNFNITTTTGTLEGKNWAGEAETITFNVSKNTQINTITVTLDGEAGELPPPAPTIANTPETAYTVAKAHELITAGEGLDVAVYVKGTVSQIDEIDTDKYGNATYYISDNGTTEGQLEVYRGYGLNGQKFNEEGATVIKVGDAVVVYGKLVDYKGTHEFTTGSQIYSLNVTDGIGNIALDAATAPAFNLQGQRVAANAKGVIIINGKKFINK